jgi:hypothetical protein
MRVKLRSDFWDYYDHCFDVIADLTFERFSYGGMSRREMFEFLESIGLHVPPYGRPRDVLDQLDDFSKEHPQLVEVVVYLDERAHRGKEKIKVLLPQAMEKYSGHLVSQYIPALPSGNGLTWRYLQVGDKIFWLRYYSCNDWRSNCGDVIVEVLSREKDSYHPNIHYPLFAVDFIPAGSVLYAVDFNVAPQIKGTGVEDLLPAREAAEAIKRAFLRKE